MKIVHVLPSFARGGGERLVIELANHQAAAGHTVHIVVGHRLADDLVHEPPHPSVGVTFVAPAALSRARRYLAGFRWLARNRKWLAEQDVIHAHLTYGAVMSSAFRTMTRNPGRNDGPAIIETYHAVGMPIPRIMRWWHARMAARHDALAFMVDDPRWTRLVERHPGLAKVVIPAGVFVPPAPISEEERKRYRASLGIPDGALVVGTIGRMAPERQTHRYARIFGGIAARSGARTHFFVGGDGPERRRVEAAFDAAFPTKPSRRRVHFAGLVRDLDGALSIMDLYITSNIGSDCGVAGLQAIGAGVPTLALQLRDGHSATAEDWIWSSSDEDEVAVRAAELLSSAEDRRALQQKQRAYLEQNHSANAMTAAYERLYEETISRKQQG